jgi:hypothetical protein
MMPSNKSNRLFANILNIINFYQNTSDGWWLREANNLALVEDLT